MKLGEIVVPYHKTKNIQYRQRLLLEMMNINNDESFGFRELNSNIPGVYNSLNSFIVSYKIRIFFRRKKIIDFDKILYEGKIKNIMVFQLKGLYILDIDFYSDETLRKIVFSDIDYLNFIAERFIEFINGDDFKRRKKKYDDFKQKKKHTVQEKI